MMIRDDLIDLNVFGRDAGHGVIGRGQRGGVIDGVGVATLRPLQLAAGQRRQRPFGRVQRR